MSTAATTNKQTLRVNHDHLVSDQAVPIHQHPNNTSSSCRYHTHRCLTCSCSQAYTSPCCCCCWCCIMSPPPPPPPHPHAASSTGSTCCTTSLTAAFTSSPVGGKWVVETRVCGGVIGRRDVGRRRRFRGVSCIHVFCCTHPGYSKTSIWLFLPTTSQP